MSREVLMQIFNTLTQIEIKGYDNIDKMCGVLYAIRAELSKQEQQPQAVQEEEK